MTSLQVTNEPTPSKSSACSYWRLYLARFLGAWGYRQWWFACGIFVFNLRPKNLMLNASNGLAQALSQVLLGSWIGAWIDNNERMFAFKAFLLLQCISIVVACTLVGIFFYSDDQNYGTITFAIIIITLACLSELGNFGNKIVLERDWVVQISSSQEDLAVMNTIFQTIDLGCKTMAPIFVGLMIQFAGITITAIVLGLWNIFSGILQYFLMHIIFREYPALLTREQKTGERKNGWFSKLNDAWRGWKIYMTHPVRNAGLALACLYMTVLAFGNVLWAYSLLQCVKESILSALVGIAAINGILGSMAFPPLRKRFGVKCAGQVGMLSQMTALFTCVVAVFLPGSSWRYAEEWDEELQRVCPNPISVHVLLAGVVAARFGLWLSDIAITQIQQQEVEEEIRGVIGGVQGSLNSTQQLIMYGLVLLFPTAPEFGYLVFASFGVFMFALALYTSYAVPCCTLCWRSSRYTRHIEDDEEGRFEDVSTAAISIAVMEGEGNHNSPNGDELTDMALLQRISKQYVF